MILGCILAPASAPQIPVCKPNPPQHQSAALNGLDRRIIDTLRDSGICPIWSLLHVIADEEVSGSRSDVRNRRAALWQNVRRLRRRGLLFLVGRNLISPTPVDAEMRNSVRRSRRRPVRKPTARRAGRAQSASTVSNSPELSQLVHFEVDAEKTAPSQPPPKTKTAVRLEQISEAARSLARLPRKQAPRRWTGWLHGNRLWRGALVELPGGRVASVYGILRRHVVILKDPSKDEFPPFDVFPAEQVRRWKNPEAVMLAKLKRGVRERRSIKKLLACWQNGRQPVRQGRRPRGRPRGSELHTER